MITKKTYVLLLPLLWCNGTIYPMKRTLDDASAVVTVATPVEINPEIFKYLPSDVLPRILAYAGMSKSELIRLSKHFYKHFCCRNYDIIDPVVRENWKNVCNQYPWLIAANKYDCQRVYYLLIQEDDLTLMEQLLKADKNRIENIKQVVAYLYNRPFEFIGSEQMRALMNRICLGEDGGGTWCYQCKENEQYADNLCDFCAINCKNPYPSLIPYKKNLAEQKDIFINSVMMNSVDILEEKVNKQEMTGFIFFGSYTINLKKNFFNHLFKFCSQNTLEKLVLFIKTSPLNQIYNILEDEMCRALDKHDYDKAQYFVDHGVNVNANEDPDSRDLLVVALELVLTADDYKMLSFLVKNKAILDLDVETAQYGFSFNEFDTVIREKLHDYFGAQSLENIISDQVSPLLYAVLHDNAQLVKTLLDAGADSYAPQSCQDGGDKDNPQRMAHIDLLDIARALGNQAIIDAIIEARKTVETFPQPTTATELDFVDSLFL